MSVTVASGNNTGLPDQTKIAADVVGTGTAPGAGDLVPYVKLDLGATGDSAPVEGTLPVSGTVAVSNFPATQPMSAAALPLPAGASTEATLAAIKAKTDNLDVLLSTRTKPADVQHVDGSGVTQPVSGTVAVNNFPATLTDTQLRASPVPVSGTIADSNSAPLSSGGQGSKNIVTAGTPLQLVGVSTPCAMLFLTARNGNGGNIAWGWSNTVRATAGAEVGAVLTPGETVVIPVTDVQKIWIDAKVAGEGVSFTYGS